MINSQSTVSQQLPDIQSGHGIGLCIQLGEYAGFFSLALKMAKKIPLLYQLPA
jgi:hypothetical protein